MDNSTEKKTISKDDVIAKLKDDGDFDRLRLKIIRKLKDNEELRSSIISVVKHSAVLNGAGAENMKPRQLSDAIYEDVRSKVMSQISDGVWEIIKSADGMKNEITETVQSVYNKLVNFEGKEEVESSTHNVTIVEKEAQNNDSAVASASGVDDTLSDCEPKEPPGFSLSGNHRDNNHEEQHNKELQLSVPYEKRPTEEQKEELHGVDLHVPPGFAADMENKQLTDGSDEDPDVPPGFG